MSKKETSSSGCVPTADKEKLLPPLPRTPHEALCCLEGAALYLEESYFDSECKRNEGWGQWEGPRQAYSILTHKSAELIVEGQTSVWMPQVPQGE